MSLPKVFVARRIPQCGLDRLAQHADVRLHDGRLPPSRSELLAGVQDCNGILSLLSDQIDSEVIEAAGPNLSVIANFAVGFNNIDVAEATRRKIAVGNTPDVLTEATADLAVTLILAIARKVREAGDAVLSGGWKTWEPTGWQGVELAGKTLGIVGMGRIGEAVARRMHGGWGMKVLYTARTKKDHLAKQFTAEPTSLDHLLASSDVVSLHVPLSDDTRNLIGARELAQLQPNAILVNTARGEIIDQRALVETLAERKILGAGLDVCTPEPLPTNSPLLALPNCLVLPHIGSATLPARNAMAQRAADNIIAGIQGNPLPFPVA